MECEVLRSHVLGATFPAFLTVEGARASAAVLASQPEDVWRQRKTSPSATQHTRNRIDPVAARLPSRCADTTCKVAGYESGLVTRVVSELTIYS
jgi:hypothetical protein